ncbi:hypothetical protein [Promicromonospora sp. NFX87]|uniref:hypothetical protein n=1 Tax=Promicromonospora sp. NFX87 TaxID=3402691 RepID=UPI003AFA67BD
MPQPEPATSARATDALPLASETETRLIASGTKWAREALDAWADDDYEKVAVAAPLSIELISKAVLWRVNPVLLVQLSEPHENSLVALATKADLALNNVKTIGLQLAFGRLEKVLGDLPVAKDRRTRIVNVRNGAVHAGTTTEARFVLLDCLTLLMDLLKPLGVSTETFFGTHTPSVQTLLHEGKSEIAGRVAAKRVRARSRLTQLEDTLGSEAFEVATDSLQEQRWSLDTDARAFGHLAIDWDCPECGSIGRLAGRVDGRAEADVDGDGSPFGPHPEWQAELAPAEFSCAVCRLHLSGRQELAQAGLPSQLFDVDEDALGEDFDLDAHLLDLYMGDD